MTSDMLRFFRMGFLIKLTNEFVFERDELGA